MDLAVLVGLVQVAAVAMIAGAAFSLGRTLADIAIDAIRRVKTE